MWARSSTVTATTFTERRRRRGLVVVLSVSTILEELNVARMTRRPEFLRLFESGAADDLGRVDDERAGVRLEEIQHADGGVVCEQQGATELNARAPWQGWGGSVGVAARGQAPVDTGATPNSS